MMTNRSRCKKDFEMRVKVITVADMLRIMTRRAAAYMLCDAQDPRTNTALITLLYDVDELTCTIALAALGERHDARAVLWLLQLLKPEYSWLQEKIIQALARIGDARAIPPIRALLSTRDLDLRRIYACYLGWLGDAHVLPDLRAIVRAPHSAWHHTVLATLGLAFLGADEALELLHEIPADDILVTQADLDRARAAYEIRKDTRP
jgi:HEAT repeat protein